MASTPDTVALAALGAMLACAVATDVARQRIPNALVAAGLAGAALASLLPGGIGPAGAAAGALAGLLALLPLHLMRGMGAGDVKLMAAVGAFVGWPGVVPVVVYTLAAGGLLSLFKAVQLGRLRGVLANVRTGVFLASARVVQRRLPQAADFPVSAQRIPYAVAIAAGTAIHLITSRAA